MNLEGLRNRKDQLEPVIPADVSADLESSSMAEETPDVSAERPHSAGLDDPTEQKVMELLHARAEAEAAGATHPVGGAGNPNLPAGPKARQNPDADAGNEAGNPDDPKVRAEEDLENEAWRALATQEELDQIDMLPDGPGKASKVDALRQKYGASPKRAPSAQPSHNPESDEIKKQMDALRKRQELENRQNQQRGSHPSATIAEVIAAPFTLATKAVLGTTKLAAKGVVGTGKLGLKGVRHVSPIAKEKLQQNAFERRNRSFDKGLESLEREGASLAGHVGAFNLAFMNTAKYRELESHARSRGKDMSDVLVEISNGTADPAALAIARDALNDPKVLEASIKIDQSLKKIRNTSQDLHTIESKISKSAKSGDFDAEEKHRKADEVRSKILGSVPDPLVRDPEDEELKERLKKSMSAFLEMIQNMFRKITAPLRR